jgi:hypothetical protein
MSMKSRASENKTKILNEYGHSGRVLAPKFRTMGVACRPAGQKPQINCHGDTLCMVSIISPCCFQTSNLWRFNCSTLNNA